MRMGAQTLVSSSQLAIAIFASAFIEDLVLEWFMRQDRGRSDALRRFFSIVVHLSLESGALVDVDDDGRGAALWFTPGDSPPDLDLLATVRLLPDMVKVCSLSRIGRLLHVERVIKTARSKIGRHWYLPPIGVAPEYQHRGLGSALLERGLL